MKIFYRTHNQGWGNRLNIIDENNVFVGFDYEQDCCEYFGYYFTSKEPVGFQEECLDESSFNHEGYVFDTSYSKPVLGLKDEFDEGGAIVFKLTKLNNPDIFLVLYNIHNGYYSHGFCMKINEDSKENIYEDYL